jgi:hypothetical protein
MRTTVKIDDDLLVEVKTWAAASGRTLNDVVEDALRQALARRAAAADTPFELPVHHGGRLMPGVDLDDSAALLELMEAPE